MDVPLPEHKIASSSWTPEGNLFVSDELGDVWLVAIDINKLYSVVKSEARGSPKNKSIVVSHKGGVIVVNADNKIAVSIDLIWDLIILFLLWHLL